MQSATAVNTSYTRPPQGLDMPHSIEVYVTIVFAGLAVAIAIFAAITSLKLEFPGFRGGSITR